MLRLLFDENFNHRILRGLARTVTRLDFIVAQRAGLRGMSDPELLRAAAEERRILVTHDLETIPKHAYERLHAGQFMPEVIAVSDRLPIGQVIEELRILTECCSPEDLESRVLYLPI